MKQLLFLLIPVVLLFSCKKDSAKVNQNKIYQTYRITYNAGTNQTTFTARFNEKKETGKALKLSEGSNVTINGDVMQRSGSVYTTTYNGYYNTGTFVFTDTKGKTYTNTIYGEQSISNDINYYLDNSAPKYWYFGGNSIETGETVTINIQSQATDGGSATAQNYNVGAFYVYMTVSDMSSLQPGFATLTTKRVSETVNGNWTSVGGRMESTYTSPSSTIEVY